MMVREAALTCANVSQRLRSLGDGDRPRVPQLCPASPSSSAADIWRRPEAAGEDQTMARYVLARLHGGPLDGQLVHAPIDRGRLPAHVVGLPVPALDEQDETFWWDTANYFCMSLRAGWRTGDPWD